MPGEQQYDKYFCMSHGISRKYPKGDSDFHIISTIEICEALYIRVAYAVGLLRQHSPQLCALKRKCCHFDEILITDCTESCHFDNFRCSKWWKFRQNDDISVSVCAGWIIVLAVSVLSVTHNMLADEEPSAQRTQHVIITSLLRHVPAGRSQAIRYQSHL